jgi:hypothetical protein
MAAAPSSYEAIDAALEAAAPPAEAATAAEAEDSLFISTKPIATIWTYVIAYFLCNIL